MAKKATTKFVLFKGYANRYFKVLYNKRFDKLILKCITNCGFLRNFGMVAAKNWMILVEIVYS